MKLISVLLITFICLFSIFIECSHLKRKKNKNNKKVKKVKAIDQPLADWLRMKKTGKFPLTLPMCDNLSRGFEFIKDFPNGISNRSAYFYLGKDAKTRLAASGLKIKYYVSNLRRAADTFLYSFYPVDARATKMTSDIQEMSRGFDASVSKKDRQSTGGRPKVGTHQRKTLELLTADTPKLNTQKSKDDAIRVEEERISRFYNELDITNSRIHDHQDWPSKTKMNDLWISDLEADCKAGVNVVLATGHSMYFQAFVKTNSNNAGTCKNAAENKLNNGAIMGMVVKFDQSCKAVNKFVSGCSLVYGSFLNSKGCSPDDFNQTNHNTEIREGMQPGFKQILVFAQRHGRSHWNEAEHQGAIAIAKELLQEDSPLWPNGICDAVALNNRLQKPESINDCNTCPDDKGCGPMRSCARNYQGE